MIFNRIFLFVVFCFLAVSFSLQDLCAGGNEKEGKKTHVRKTYKRTLSGSIKEIIGRQSYDESDDDSFLEAVIKIEEEYLRNRSESSSPSSAGSDDSCVTSPAKKQKLSDSTLVNSDDDDEDFLGAVLEFEESYLRNPSESSSPSSAGSDDSYATSTEKKQKLSDLVLVSSDDDDDEDFLGAVLEFEESYLRDRSESSFPSSAGSDDSCATSLYNDGFNFQHLVTPQEHQDFMIGAINRAKKSVLITSYNFTAHIRRGTALRKAIENANKRGVKFYLYANTIASIPSLNYLSNLRNMKIEEATFHAKLFVVDSKEIACGSYDWLADPWRGVSENASIVLEGDNLQPVVDCLWEVLKKYRALDFSSQLSSYMQKWFENLPRLEYQFETDENSFFILNTPCQHDELFVSCFEEARDQITICVPFVSGCDGFLQTFFPSDLLISFLQSGKKLNLFYNPEYEKGRLRKYLDFILSGRFKYLRKNINLRAVNGLHRKTLFIDNDQYIEGSYNWLLSARELRNSAAKMEASIGFIGDEASRLIEKFRREFN